ncbi:MAG: dTDP-4-dehydrorhamnose reductase [Pseudomonadota bacterium]
MTLLCIGKSGQVARALAERAADRSIDLICLGRPDLDLLRTDSLKEALEIHLPRAVINAAAYTQVDKAESEHEAAFALNAEAPTQLARLCAQAGVPLLHISTDYVFDGTADRPYTENDQTAPLSVYGASKLAGEDGVRAETDAHIILRTSWVYGPHKPNFVTTMLRLAQERGGASVVDDQFGAPTSALDIADALLDIANQIDSEPNPNIWGTYHFVCEGKCTWADFAELIFSKFDEASENVTELKRIPTSAYPTPATRPHYSVLSTQKLTETFGIIPRDWTIAARETLTRLLERGFQ